MESDARTRILNAALELFATQGVEAVSVAAIRAAAGVSNGSFFHAFANKHDLAGELLLQCIEQYQASIRAQLACATTLEAGVRAFFDGHLNWAAERPHHARFMLEEARGAWTQAIAAKTRSLNDAFQEDVSRWRSALLAHGAIAPLSKAAITLLIIGPVHLLLRLSLTERANVGLTEMREELISGICKALAP